MAEIAERALAWLQDVDWDLEALPGLRNELGQIYLDGLHKRVVL